MEVDPSIAAEAEAAARRSEEAAEAFFRAAPPLRDRDRVAASVADFVARHSAGSSGVGGPAGVICITSGGTTVPLEQRCVRYIDNFASGQLGAAATEYARIPRPSLLLVTALFVVQNCLWQNAGIFSRQAMPSSSSIAGEHFKLACLCCCVPYMLNCFTKIGISSNLPGDDPSDAPGSRDIQPGGSRSGSAGHPSSTRSLNPDATPFAPGSREGSSRPAACSPEGLCFSIPSDSDDEEEDLLWPSPCPSAKGKEVAVPVGRSAAGAVPCRLSPTPACRPPGGFMADARRQHPHPPPPARSQAAAPLGRSATAPNGRSRVAPVVDAEGFRLVDSKRQLRGGRPRPRPQPARRPVPADLVGRCFNCLALDHVAARCTFPSRCLRCEGVEHSVRHCIRRRPVVAPQGHGRPVRRYDDGGDAAAATRVRRAAHSAASASTASTGFGSTGRPYSGPPSICAPSPWPGQLLALKSGYRPATVRAACQSID